MDAETQAAYSKLGKTYLESIEESFPREMEEFVATIPKGGRILDVGCAGGRDSAVFLRKGFSVVGIDVTDTFLEVAREIVPNGEFLRMDVLNLNLPEDEFDAVWANAILLHIEKTQVDTALENLFNVLKSGGRIHVRVKLGEGKKRVVDKFSGGKKRLFIFYREGELETKMESVGFEINQSQIIEDESGRSEVRWVSIQATKP